MLRARRHFCFIQTFFLCLGVGSSFCVGDSKKKNLIPKDKKNNQKHKRENFVSRRYFVRANASVYLQNEPRIAKLSLVLLRLFFFRRSVLFHHKDRCIPERVLFFSDLARVFFPPLPPQKKGEANFSSVFQRGWAATNAPRQNCAPTFTSGCE